MIIFGYRGMAKLLGIVTLVCRNCGNPAAHRIIRHSRWFTLFFIPIFPISVSRSMSCTFCATATKLTKQQAEELVPSRAAAPQPMGPAAEQLPPAQQYPQPNQGPAQQYPQPNQGPAQQYPQQQYPQGAQGQYPPAQQYPQPGGQQQAPRPQPYPQQPPAPPTGQQ